MANSSSDRMTARSGRAAWMHDNERGLALAADGDWAEASEAFAAAADSLARTLPSESRGTHEPLALVLGNLAQAYFRCGRVDDAMLQAQRTCALRVAIAGEDGMPVARARMDLAVMLASAGRLEEATMLVQRSISAIEHRVGEEDARLAIVLENAARIALAAGQPANAEPLLIRLHALLDAHELSTSRAEALLSRVAAVRAAQQVAAQQVAAPSTVDALPAPEASVPEHAGHAVPDDEAAARVYAHASITAHEEWEDQPLRDAVAVTDVLLRTTPGGVPVIPAGPALEPPTPDDGTFTLADADAMLDTMDLSDVLPATAVRDADAAPRASIGVTPVSEIEFDLDLAFDEPAQSATSPLTGLDVVDFVPSDRLTPRDADSVDQPLPVPLPPSAEPLALDFAVTHGTIADDAIIEGPPISTPVPGALDLAPVVPTAIPVTEIITSGPTAGIAPLTDLVQSAPMREGPPPAASAPAATSAPAASRAPTPSPSSSRPTGPSGERPARRSAEQRVVLPKSEPTGGKGKGAGMRIAIIAIVAAVVAVGGGAAAFFLLR